jgi:hypothetical protein
MSFLKPTAKFVFVQLINLLMFIAIRILKYSFSVFVDLMKYVIKQIIWYLAIFIKFAIFKIIKLFFHLMTTQKLKCFKKKQHLLDVMTDDETDYETDDDD